MCSLSSILCIFLFLSQVVWLHLIIQTSMMAFDSFFFVNVSFIFVLFHVVVFSSLFSCYCLSRDLFKSTLNFYTPFRHLPLSADNRVRQSVLQQNGLFPLAFSNTTDPQFAVWFQTSFQTNQDLICLDTY